MGPNNTPADSINLLGLNWAQTPMFESLLKEVHKMLDAQRASMEEAVRKELREN